VAEVATDVEAERDRRSRVSAATTGLPAVRATRRRVWGRPAGILAGGLLAACGGTPNARGRAGVASPVPTPALSGALAVANMLTSPEQDAIRVRTVEVFRERYPNVRVEEVAAPLREYNQKLLALLADGTLPDVLHLYFGQAAGGPADLAARGALLPLDGYVGRDARPGALGWEELWPAARRAGTFEGAQLALPYNGVNAVVVYVNRDLEQAAGRVPSDELERRGQWTWATLVEEATRLTTREDGVLVRAGLGSPLHWEPGTWATVLLRAYGADYLSPDGQRVVVDTPAGREALRVLQELGPRRRTMPLAGDGDSVELIRQGRVAQALLWFVAAAWWRPLSFDWDVAPTPSGPAGRPAHAVTNRLGIAARSRAPDLAWAYALLAVSPEIDLDQAIRFGQLPLRASSLDGWREETRRRRPANLAPIEATLRDMRLEPLRRPHPQSAAVDALLQRELTELLLASKPADEVARTLAVEGNALLAGA
jgi:multiple sugar transport system substrate-binding protein